MRKVTLSLMTALALLGATELEAQSNVANGNVSITVPQVLYINVVDASPTFASPTAADFNSGSIASSSQAVLSHRGNVVHDVEIVSAASNMSGGSGIKPASDFEWSKDSGSTWSGLSTTAVDLVTAAAAGVHDNAVTIDYRMLLDYATDEPATYTLAFSYTVVAN